MKDRPPIIPLDLKPTPEAEAVYRRWLAHLNDEFNRHASADRRAEIVRDELHQLFLGHPHGGRMNSILSSELATNVLTESFDPRNVTLAAEYHPHLDVLRFAPRKPLVFFWQMFDRSALGANLWLGIRMRCMLAHHIFAAVGNRITIHPGVDFTFGYNITLLDDCTIPRGTFVDDLHPVTLPNHITP